MKALVAVLLAATLALAGSAVPASGGLGEGSPTLTLSTTAVPADRATDVTVRGSDFLVPPHDCPVAEVFGGVYVLFGWVATTTGWGPSSRSSTSSAGVFGATYAYPGEGGDASIRDDGSGRVRLVAFTAGGESGAATPFHMDCNGDWETTMTIHSPVFQYVVPSTGEVRTVDCRTLTSGRCGIFTIGAHGKASATNERFVPVAFTGGSPAAPVDPGPSDPVGGTRPGRGDTVAPSGDEVAEVVEVRTPFTSADEAEGLPGTGAGSAPAAAGVPGASGGAPVAVAVAGGPTLSYEPTSVASTGRVPRWLVATAGVAVVIAGASAAVRRRRRGGLGQEAAS